MEHILINAVTGCKPSDENFMNPNTSRISRTLRDWLPSLLLLILLLAARSTLADHYHVPSGSMEHALVPGDHIVVNKAAYGLRIPFTKDVLAFASGPRRGEVVIFDSPVDGVRLIKRVVAVEGDRVAVRNGRVVLNGETIAAAPGEAVERFGERSARLKLSHGGGPDLPAMTVPRGHVLVLGDHRGNSRDGRYFGSIPASEIYGRASGVFWRAGDGPLWQPL
jgi:signal peptidase I